MSHDADVLDSLPRAIAEFREKVLLWIDTALVRLREREQEESLAMEDLLSVPTRPPIVAPRPEAGTRSKSSPLDSLERLDALARLLDHRLKASQEAASNSSETSGEVGESNG